MCVNPVKSSTRKETGWGDLLRQLRDDLSTLDGSASYFGFFPRKWEMAQRVVHYASILVASVKIYNEALHKYDPWERIRLDPVVYLKRVYKGL